jgi:hypothetical protein
LRVISIHEFGVTGTAVSRANTNPTFDWTDQSDTRLHELSVSTLYVVRSPIFEARPGTASYCKTTR